MTFSNTRTLQFSPSAFRELSERLPRAEEKPLQYTSYGRTVIAPMREGCPTVPPGQPYTAYDVERAMAIRDRVRAYGEEPPRERLFRYAQWVALVLAVAFIATIVVMMAILSVRVSAVFDNIDGDDTQAKVDSMVDMVVDSAANARLATQNVLQVTESARLAANIAAPRLVHAVNETSDLVEDLRSWSFHPSLQIAPGKAAAG